MDEAEFRDLMEEVDAELARRQVPLPARTFAAYLSIASRWLSVPQGDWPAQGPYCLANISGTIQEWYTERYGDECVDKGRRVRRPVMIRGAVYWLEVPYVLSAEHPPPATDCIPGLTVNLRNALTRKARDELQRQLCCFYGQTLLLRCLWVRIITGVAHGLADQLLVRGSEDLEHATAAFDGSAPSAILFPCQQATEKFLKAALVLADAEITEQTLKSRYGHNIGKLMEAVQAEGLLGSESRPHAMLLASTSETRYGNIQLSPAEAIEALNSAWAVCYDVGQRLLREHYRKSAQA